MATRARPPALFDAPDRALAGHLAELAVANPFAEHRVALERAILGADFVHHAVWSLREDADPGTNAARIGERAASLLGRLDQRLAAGATPSAEDRARYREVVTYHLFHGLEADLYGSVLAAGQGSGSIAAPYFSAFAAELRARVARVGESPPADAEAAHLFACMFQIRRAFHHVFRHVIGGSRPTARLRAAIWESVFTHDLRRYVRSLHDRMADIPTLVLGPSGSGKELVARAVSLARYVPFDAGRRAFAVDLSGAFFPVHLAALPPTLIEAELFGHRRGAFTGALADRAGFFEACPPFGTVFLDEIAEAEGALQVKLLRVLEARSFARVGETKARRFAGKVLAATNRDLPAEIASGRFREDLYYRLCADLVTTPSLAERVQDSPAELVTLVRFISERVAGAGEAEALSDDVLAVIDRDLGPEYPWPGNVRELEQCVRNVLVRRAYRPARVAVPREEGRAERLLETLRAGELSAEMLVSEYASLVYTTTGSYVATAERLGLDRRTVARRIAAARRASTPGRAVLGKRA